VGVYAVGQIAIRRRSQYERYAARFMSTLEKYGGRLLAADERPEIVQGDWPFDKLIILEFPDAQSFHSWEMSSEYREIVADRLAATEGVILLASGIGGKPCKPSTARSARGCHPSLK
jgi:uncharacterized protein (DUF1330 family)